MGYVNGRLPDRALRSIPGGRLERRAAIAWNALYLEGVRKDRVRIMPAGPVSSYRTYAEQVERWNIYKRGGPLAAEPGTSNHGWGRAVDLKYPAAMRPVIDKYGAKYGWRWGEAPSEPWHVTFYDAGHLAAVKNRWRRARERRLAKR